MDNKSVVKNSVIELKSLPVIGVTELNTETGEYDAVETVDVNVPVVVAAKFYPMTDTPNVPVPSQFGFISYTIEIMNIFNELKKLGYKCNGAVIKDDYAETVKFALELAMPGVADSTIKKSAVIDMFESGLVNGAQDIVNTEGDITTEGIDLTFDLSKIVSKTDTTMYYCRTFLAII